MQILSHGPTPVACYAVAEKYNMRRLLFLTAFALALVFACATEPEAPLSADPPGTETHRFDEVAPGVYFVSGTGVVNVMSNALVVVNDEDVLVADSHITPDAARELIASIKTVTDKPITTLVNSHFHYDHAHGNQVFGPDVEIIGHEYTRMKLAGDVLNEDTYRLMGSPEALAPQLEEMEREVAEADGEEELAAVKKRVDRLARHIEALKEIRPTPPTRTFTESLTLQKGSREIQLHHLGRAHTGGDVVIYLPEEKVLFTGDLFYDGPPYLGDSFPVEFVETLERLKELEFDVIVGGHGPLVWDAEKITLRQEYIRDYYGQAKRFFDEGLSAEEALLRIDLSTYGKYAASRKPDAVPMQLEVRRMYHRLAGGE